MRASVPQNTKSSVHIESEQPSEEQDLFTQGDCLRLELEIKNIATLPDYQKQGYARKLFDFLVAKYSKQYSVLQVGTGDSPLTIPFYEKCGFIRSYVVKNFFIDNYDPPIFECGKQLIDMVYLQKNAIIFTLATS